MSFSRYRVPVVTAADGSFATTLHAQGSLRAVQVTKGTLDTPDITFTDMLDDTAILTLTGVSADGRYYPSAPVCSDSGDAVDAGAMTTAPEVFGRLGITVAGGGNQMSGTIFVVIER